MRRLQPGENAQQRALSRSVVAGKNVARAGFEHQVRDAQNRLAAPCLDEPVDLDHGCHARLIPPCPCTAASATFTASASTISTIPSATPCANSPLLVSSAMAVGMLRVSPAMLPPTINEQPISETMRPNPTNTAAITPKRTSHNVVIAARTRPAPRLDAVS